MKISDLFEEYCNRLSGRYDEREAAAIAELVFEKITGRTRLQRRMDYIDELETGLSDQLESALARLLRHEPVQYVLGEAWFYKLCLKVTPAVLIPRPETEELVDWVISNLKAGSKKINNVLDVGTGSGCIAIALKRNKPAISMTAIDISEAALDIAKENAARCRADIDFLRMDILKAGSREALPMQDFIVSNPPYIPLAEKSMLGENVTSFEPGSALFVPDDQPLLFYEALADLALQKLSARGSLFVEINEMLGEEVCKLFVRKGLRNVELRKDIFGKPRMIKAIRESTKSG